MNAAINQKMKHKHGGLGNMMGMGMGGYGAGGMDSIKDQMRDQMQMHHERKREAMELVHGYGRGDRDRDPRDRGDSRDRGYGGDRRDKFNPHARKDNNSKDDKYKDTPIQVTIQNTSEKKTQKKTNNNLPDMAPQSFLLTQNDGSIRYKLFHYDHAEICITSYVASRSDPTLFQFRIQELDDVAVDMNMNLEDVSPHDGLTEEERAKNQQDVKGGQEHFKFLERELNKMISRVNSMERYCASSKRDEGEFHDDSVKFIERLRWFSMVQIGVMVLAAYANSKVVVEFLRRKGFLY